MSRDQAALHHSVASPIGPLTLIERDGALAGLDLGGGIDTGRPPSGLLADAAAQLAAYFAGRRRTFDLPLAPASTAHAEKVRAAMLAIALGQTVSYGDIALAIASAPRAVGQACRNNPIAIIVPCHRVLAGGGRIGGFAGASQGNGRGQGAELARKRWLLAHEGAALI